jgi:hypothetical protein
LRIVISTLALCMGGAFATGLIGSKQIRNSSIRSADLANGGVHTSDQRKRGDARRPRTAAPLKKPDLAGTVNSTFVISEAVQ